MDKCQICGEENCKNHADIPIVGIEDLPKIIESFGAGDGLLLLRDRPYMGQAHTDYGERGKTEIQGITFRDLRDCFLRACCVCDWDDKNDKPTKYSDEANKGEMADLCENDLYKLNWDSIDPVAIAQNLSCEIEKIMGIFPNVPKLSKESQKPITDNQQPPTIGD